MSVQKLFATAIVVVTGLKIRENETTPEEEVRKSIDRNGKLDRDCGGFDHNKQYYPEAVSIKGGDSASLQQAKIEWPAQIPGDLGESTSKKNMFPLKWRRPDFQPHKPTEHRETTVELQIRANSDFEDEYLSDIYLMEQGPNSYRNLRPTTPGKFDDDGGKRPACRAIEVQEESGFTHFKLYSMRKLIDQHVARLHVATRTALLNQQADAIALQNADADHLNKRIQHFFKQLITLAKQIRSGENLQERKRDEDHSDFYVVVGQTVEVAQRVMRLLFAAIEKRSQLGDDVNVEKLAIQAIMPKEVVRLHNMYSAVSKDFQKRQWRFGEAGILENILMQAMTGDLSEVGRHELKEVLDSFLLFFSPIQTGNDQTFYLDSREMYRQMVPAWNGKNPATLVVCDNKSYVEEKLEEFKGKTITRTKVRSKGWKYDITVDESTINEFYQDKQHGYNSGVDGPKLMLLTNIQEDERMPYDPNGIYLFDWNLPQKHESVNSLLSPLVYRMREFQNAIKTTE